MLRHAANKFVRVAPEWAPGLGYNDVLQQTVMARKSAAATAAIL